MPCSAKFSRTLRNIVVSTETSHFLKQIIFLKSFSSVFITLCNNGGKTEIFVYL